jgi:very-short-patch-repair endonuclease
MRREPTPFERKLWLAVRAKRWNGAKFRRQMVIGGYIVDLACRLPRKLVVEVDGDTHGSQESYDSRRTADLLAKGYEVLRFTNRDVGENLEGVLLAIENALAPLPSLSPEGERV